jgi:plastocyanin
MRRIALPISAVALALLAAGCMNGGHHDDANQPVEPGARKIPVAATSFEFDPDEITVDAGEDVTIVLTSDDISHDFVVDGQGGHIVGTDGSGTERGGLNIDKPGKYDFYCSLPGHRDGGMEGTVVVK